MKNFRLMLLMVVSVFLLSSITVNAQKIKLVKGNFSQLKGQSSLNVEYVYEVKTVGKMTEEEYIKKKTDEYNAKVHGKGDNWAKTWKTDRTNRYQPKFEELMNKYLNEVGITVGSDEKAKYTVVITTTMMEPGYNVYVSKKPALINVNISFVETANRSADIATVTIEKSPGSQFSGTDYDAGVRIAESYAKAGKELAKLMLKKGLK